MKKKASPNFDDRGGKPIDILLLHYTGLSSAKAALDRLCDPEARVSAHYFIDEAGDIIQLVPERKRAWHAGRSYWAGETDINASSIGVELVNPGHELGYVDFPDTQIQALIHLAKDILTRLEIPFYKVLAHSDVAPSRKMDPGEKFPWSVLAKDNIGLWDEDLCSLEPAFNSFRLDDDELAGFSRCLRTIGYGMCGGQQLDASVITAFQRHFHPKAIGTPAEGTSDEITLRIAESLETDVSFWTSVRSS